MDEGHSFSFPLGVPLVAFPRLALAAAAGQGRWWGWALTAACVALTLVFVWEAFSRSEFEKIRSKDPSMNITTWRFNWLVFFVLPGVLACAWALLGNLRRP